MLTSKCLVTSVTLSLITAPLSGCLERKETIRVTPDGRVRISLKYEGAPADFEGGDAMPSDDGGWDPFITREGAGDDESMVLVSARSFDANAVLPSSYASEDDADKDLYLQFPTTLTVERDASGTYYHFSRRYLPRPWAQVQYWQDLALEGEGSDSIDHGAQDMTLDARIEIIKKFAAIEMFKQSEYAREALNQCAPDLGQRPRALARQCLMHVFSADPVLGDRPTPNLMENGTYLKKLVSRCDPLTEDERNQCYETEADRVLAVAYDAMVQSLRTDAEFSDADVRAFDRAFARAKRRHEITEAIGAHQFEICVTMPGRIVAHNAYDASGVQSDDGAFNRVCWEMEGKAVHDREVEMLVTSFVPASPSDE